MTRATAGARIEPYTLPAPTQPKNRVSAAHKALHALGRACEIALGQRQPGTIRRPLELIEAFAVDFPSGGFHMDGEPGTTLALLIVVWDELKGGSPPRVPEVERLIPISYRGN